MSAPINGIEVTWVDEAYLSESDNDGDIDNPIEGSSDHESGTVTRQLEEKRWNQIYSLNGICNRKMEKLMQEKEEIGSTSRWANHHEHCSMSLEEMNKDPTNGSKPKKSSEMVCCDAVAAAMGAMWKDYDPKTLKSTGEDDATLATVATNPELDTSNDDSQLQEPDRSRSPILIDPMEDWDELKGALTNCATPLLTSQETQLVHVDTFQKHKEASTRNVGVPEASQESNGCELPSANDLVDDEDWNEIAGAFSDCTSPLLTSQEVKLVHLDTISKERKLFGGSHSLVGSQSGKSRRSTATASSVGTDAIEAEWQGNRRQQSKSSRGRKERCSCRNATKAVADDEQQQEINPAVGAKKDSTMANPSPMDAFAMLELEEIDRDMQDLMTSPVPTFDGGEDEFVSSPTGTSGGNYGSSRRCDSSHGTEQEGSLLMDPNAMNRQEAKAAQSIEIVYDPSLFEEDSSGEGRRACWPARGKKSQSRHR